MGFVLLGVATLTATGIQAALIGNIAHGIITGLLFFLAGAVKDRFHTGDLAALGGLRERTPTLSGLLAFAAIASLGLPGLAGFWGEAFAVVAAFQRGRLLWVALRRAGRGRRGADGGVLPADAAQGHPRPGRRRSSPRPAAPWSARRADRLGAAGRARRRGRAAAGAGARRSPTCRWTR